jgi:hypothetical protein
MTKNKKRELGQAYAEFVIALPILLMLIGGIFVAGFYAWRSAAANWGVFISGVAGGSFDPSAIHRVQKGIWWPDIRNAITVVQNGKVVRSEISINAAHNFFGIPVTEVQTGSADFYLWRFRPGPNSTP